MPDSRRPMITLRRVLPEILLRALQAALSLSLSTVVRASFFLSSDTEEDWVIASRRSFLAEAESFFLM